MYAIRSYYALLAFRIAIGAISYCNATTCKLGIEHTGILNFIGITFPEFCIDSCKFGYTPTEIIKQIQRMNGLVDQSYNFV